MAFDAGLVANMDVFAWWPSLPYCEKPQRNFGFCGTDAIVYAEQEAHDLSFRKTKAKWKRRKSRSWGAMMGSRVGLAA
jgi:hypothetical protein